MTVTAATLLDRADARYFYSLTLELTDEDSDDLSLRLSDADYQFGEFQYNGVVTSWGAFQWGRIGLARFRYPRATATIELAVDRVADQALGKNLHNILNQYRVLGATATIELHVLDVPSGGGDPSQNRIVGRVVDQERIDPEHISLRIESDTDIDVTLPRSVYAEEYPGANPEHTGIKKALLAGRVGADDRKFWESRAPAQTGGPGGYFRRIGQLHGMYPVPMIDEQDQLVAVSSGAVTAASLNGGPILACRWAGSEIPTIFEESAAGWISAPAGTLTIPVASDGLVQLGRFCLPSGVTDDVEKESYYPGWRNMFDREKLDTYCTDEHTASNYFKINGQPFITPPIDVDDGAVLVKVYVLLLCRLKGMGTYPARVQAYVNAPSVGYWGQWMDADYITTDLDWYLLSEEMSSGHDVFAYIAAGNWGADPTDHLQIHRDPARTDDARYHLFGVYCVWDVPIHSTGTREPRTIREAKLYFGGYGESSLEKPAHCIRAAMDTATGGAIDALGGDWQSGASAHGSHETFADEQDQSLEDNCDGVILPDDDDVGAVAAICDIRETSSQRVLEEWCSGNYSIVYRNPTDQKYNMVFLKNRSAATVVDGEALVVRKRYLTGMPRCRYTPLADVVNSPRVDFDLDRINGGYRRSVWIDKSGAEQSHDWAGARDATMEALSELSQDVYGRRPFSGGALRLDYVQQAKTAWDVCVREFLLRREQAAELELPLSTWAHRLRFGMVLETAEDLADVLRFPFYVGSGQSSGVWYSNFWMVTGIVEKPGTGFVVEAVKIDL